MRKVRVILVVLVTTIILCAAALSVLIVTLDDDDYRWIVTRAARHFAGLDVTLEGPFSVDLSSEPLIEASNINVRHVSEPAPSKAKIGRLEIRVALKPLLSGTILIKHLLIDDATASIVRSSEAESGDEASSRVFIPIVESASLRNVHLTVSDDAGSETASLLLSNLSLNDMGDKGPLSLKAAGKMNRGDFQIDGQLGSLADLRKKTEPYPLDVHVKGAGLRLNLSGTVDDLRRGQGMNIRASGGHDELGDILRLFWKDLPKLGAVDFDGLVTGNVNPPGVLSLEDVFISAGKADGIQVKCKGQIGKISLSGGKAVSDVSAQGSIQAKKASAFASLFGASIPDLGPMKATLQMTEQEGVWNFKDIEVSTESQESLSLKGSGSFSLIGKDGAVSLAGLDAEIKGSAPSLSAISATEDLDLPDLRPLALKARVTDQGDGLNVLDIQEFTLNAGSGNAFLSLQGKTTELKGKDQKAFETLFKTTSKPWVLKWLDGSTPENHNVDGKLKVSGTPKEMRIETLEIGTPGSENLYVKADGMTKQTEDTCEFKGRISAGASDTAFLQSFLGVELGPLGTPQVEGQFKGSLKEASYEGTVRFGNSEFKTTLSHSFAEKRPRIVAKIVAPTVKMADLGVYPEPADLPPDLPSETESEPEPEYRLFSDRPLSFETLRAVDLSLSIDVDEITGADFVLKKLNIDMSLEDGKLHVAPAKIGYQQGEFSVDLTVDAAASKPAFALKVTVEDADIGELIAHVHEQAVLSGRLSLIADLQSQGNSPREIATSLGGEFGLAIEQGKIVRAAQLMGADAIGLLPAITLGKEYVDLNCMALRFLFDAGMGTSEVIYIDIPDTYAKGAGEIDLHSETLKIVLQPKPKKGLRGTTSPVTIQGPIYNPSVQKIPFREAAKLSAEMAMPVVFLPTRALGYLFYMFKKDEAEGAPCLEALSQSGSLDETR